MKKILCMCFFSLNFVLLQGQYIDIITEFWGDLPNIELQNNFANGLEFRILNVGIADYIKDY